MRRNSADAKQEQDSIIDLPPAKVDRQDRELNNGSEGKGGSDPNGWLEVEEQYENRRGDTAGADTCQPDTSRDQKPNNIFQFGSAPGCEDNMNQRP